MMQLLGVGCMLGAQVLSVVALLMAGNHNAAVFMGILCLFVDGFVMACIAEDKKNPSSGGPF